MTANHSRFDAENTDDALALGVWLRALESYAEGSITAADAPGEESAPRRDYADDARIVHEVLLRCSQLAVGLARAKGESVEEPVDEPVGEGMDALREVFTDATHLTEALLRSQGVGLQAWASFNNVLRRELSHSAAAERLKSEVAACGAAAVPRELVTLAEKITPEALGDDVQAVFAALTRQLEYLNFVETSLRGGQASKPLLPVFTLVNRETSELLELIEKRALKCPSAEPWVLEALDGTAYAIRMELR